MRVLMVFAMAWVAMAEPALSAKEPITVFAAASLTNAMEEVGRRFTAATQTKVRFSFASSSTLARQIEAGAPADLYMAANEDWVAYLDGKGLLDATPREATLSNRLVLVAPKDSAQMSFDLSQPARLQALLGPHDRLAVGDPAHVPAGLYARQALESLGIWHALERRLARADNVRAALVLVERGEVPLGIVYESDALLSGNVKTLAVFPSTAHAAIRYPIAVVKGRGSAEVNALFAFIDGKETRKIFERHGFSGN